MNSIGCTSLAFYEMQKLDLWDYFNQIRINTFSVLLKLRFPDKAPKNWRYLSIRFDVTAVISKESEI